MLKTKSIIENRSYLINTAPFLEFLFLLFILPLVACPLWGQVVQKKDLKPLDYKMWGEVVLEKISPDEKWASYRILYENDKDSLFIQNVKTGNKINVTGAENEVFTNHNLFIYRLQGDIQILNLNTLKTETILNARNYKYISTTDKLLITFENGEQKDLLEIRSLKTGITYHCKNTADYSVSPDETLLAMVNFSQNRYTTSVLNLSKLDSSSHIITVSTEKIKALTWENKSKAVAFFKVSDDKKISSLCYFILPQNKFYQLDPESSPEFPKNSCLVLDQFSPILISSDLKRILFPIKNGDVTLEQNSDSVIEIWNGNDKWIYPHYKHSGQFEKKPKLTIWQPDTGRIKQITSNELPEVMLSGDLKFAVLSNPLQYEPQFETQQVRDFYVLDLNTFEKKILLEKHLFEYWALNPSPVGSYFTYFKNRSWWTYDFETGIHKNVSEKTGVAFLGKAQELVPETAYGNPGWSTDREILVYDQFDIWALSCDGTAANRLTKGRESGIKFRISPQPDRSAVGRLYNGVVSIQFDLSKDVILRGSGEDGKTGYFRYNSKSGVKVIAYGDYFTDQINYGRFKKTVFFREQRFDSPPQLVSNSETQKTKTFLKSNPQHKNYHWGSSELINFQNSSGKQLKGVLLYPANYQAGVKYPMVVSIYENQSHDLHRYNNPSFENGTGLNYTLLTAEGYFVFLPDIFLEPMNPGVSATDCVISGVKKIIEKGIVKEDKIGLVGHSFGGYECASIITQTDIFAAAIASAGVTDLSNHYQSLKIGGGPPQSWRFINEQYNMKKSPYEIPDLYNANSPIKQASKIKTPILLWTGKNDPQVDPMYSYQFYLALRQLRKKCIMLVYPKQQHVLTNSVSQKDITLRTMDWFNYHLKDMHSCPWIVEGIK